MTHIWLVADDYGISPAVNGAICDLIARGRINATSVMVVAPQFGREQARRLSEANASGRAAIGLHVTLTAPFKPVNRAYVPTRDGAFLPLGRTAAAAISGRLNVGAVTDEVRAQIAAFSDAFARPPDYVDGHQHVQLFPRIRDGVLAAVRDAAPKAWVRQCGRAPRAKSRPDRKALALDLLSRGFRARTIRAGVPTNPAFAGTYSFNPAARFAELFSGFLDGMVDGGVIMCHPGVVDAELARLDPLTTLREQEYAFFKGDAYPAMMAERGVALL